MQFQIGEQITAHVPELTVVDVDVDGREDPWVTLRYQGNAVVLDLKLPIGRTITYSRVIPADGEPQPGEVWADQVDELYFVYPDNGRPQLISSHTGLRLTWEQVHAGPTGPIFRVAQRPIHTVSGGAA